MGWLDWTQYGLKQIIYIFQLNIIRAELDCEE
jgi:hypothetical protein